MDDLVMVTVSDADGWDGIEEWSEYEAEYRQAVCGYCGVVNTNTALCEGCGECVDD